MVSRETSMKFSIPLATVLGLHVVFLALDAYTMPHLDSLMHLTGGIVLGLFIHGLLSCMISRGWLPDPGRVIMLLLIVTLVVTGAVCWEFYEWLSDTFFGTHLQWSVTDTIKDLFLGMCGGMIYVVVVKLMRASGQLILKPGGSCRPIRSEG